MQTRGCALAALLLTLTLTTVSAQIRVVQSGINGRVGPVLTNGQVFCPDDFSRKGISIECIGRSDTRLVRFLVNGRQIRRVRSAPYVILGVNSRGQVRPWRTYPVDVPTSIRCVLVGDRRTRVTVTVTFSCGSPSPEPSMVTLAMPMPTPAMPMFTPPMQMPAPTPAMPASTPAMPAPTPAMPMPTPAMPMPTPAMPMPTPAMPMPTPAMPMPTSVPMPDLMPGDMVFYEAGRSGRMGPKLVDGVEFCPFDFPSRTYNIRCIESDVSTFAEFSINGMPFRRESSAPYFAGGDTAGVVASLTGLPSEFEITCLLSDGSTSTANVALVCDTTPVGDVEDTSDPDAEETSDPDVEETPFPDPKEVITTPEGCVVIDARATARLSTGWKDVGDGIVFNEGNPDTGITRSNVARLFYKFVAPVASQYAFVVDMTTMDVVDFNDIWAQFPAGGWMLTQAGVTRPGRQNRYIKVYHNNNRRELLANSVDHDPHSIATYDSLEAGVEYDVNLAGRSNQVIVHRIVMFPCEGTMCHRGDNGWRRMLNVCGSL